MELDLENPSMEGDSNALILPAERDNKRKGNKRAREVVKRAEEVKMSKSQKRKLRKLEEEKERAVMLSESLEALEKYKIPEKAFSVLKSCKNISRDETLKEKRRMAVQFSKAGLEVPLRMQAFKRSGDMASCLAEATSSDVEARMEINTSDNFQQREIEREVPNNATLDMAASTEKEVDFKFASKNASVSASCTGKASNEDFASRVQKDGDCLPTLCNYNAGNDKSLGKPDNISSADLGARNLRKTSLERPLVPPVVVPVFRPSEVEEKRRDLPVVMMEQEIMEAVNAEEHHAIIICGKTGSGKTTQVPQFLYEAGYGSSQHAARRGMIGITQPRRVAVLSTAERVAFELGLHLGKEVGFQVRYDKMIGKNCSIKVMTDGILLRELLSDFLLRQYSVIVLDEVHERSRDTDLLLGLLPGVIRVRQEEFIKQRGLDINPEDMVFPLKLILMSATLRVEDFVSGNRLFRQPPPVIDVPTRPFPLTVHFSKRTDEVDYIGQAYKKVLSVHKRLPQGGILVFVTGQREVEDLCKKLRKASRDIFAKTVGGNMQNEVSPTSKTTWTGDLSLKEINEAYEIQGLTNEQNGTLSAFDKDKSEVDENESEVSYDSEAESDEEFIAYEGDDGFSWDSNAAPKVDGVLGAGGLLGEQGILESLKASFEALGGKTAAHSSLDEKKVPTTVNALSEQSNDVSLNSKGGDKGHAIGILRVLPLYAMLPVEQQLQVFQDVKEGERLVVVATNVAETSLTIPGIKYVVDTGKVKEKSYNPSSGIETYQIQWISQASAAQRAGRAGRTGPGHCYCLYTKAAYSKFPKFSPPEITRVPPDGVVLLIKSMNFNKVLNFPFPTTPDPAALVEAERCLKGLEALDDHGRLTPMGKAMVRYPVSPRHSRMLLTAIQIIQNTKNCARPNLVIGYAVAVAAALSHRSPFYEGSDVGNNSLEEDGDHGSVGDENVAEERVKPRKNKLQERLEASRARFSNPNSDAVSAAYALQCFELSKRPKHFCYQYALDLKTMEEMSKERKQILHLVFKQNLESGIEQFFSWTYGTIHDVERAWKAASDKCPLRFKEEQILCQAICAGWADRVARKSGKQRRENAVGYQACTVTEVVFLDRSSSLFSSAPEFLVYRELLQSKKRPFLRGASKVEPEWLVKYASSHCCFPAKEDKTFDYDPCADRVFCFVDSTFGPHLWSLGKQRVEVTEIDDRVRAFAWALLEGKVLPCLKPVRKFLAANPSMILDSETAGQRRVGNLVFKLKKRMVDSRAMLGAVWKDNPRELYSEIEDWFTKSFQKNFGALWSEMLVEVNLEPSQEAIRKR